jgi:hypothetical protein
MLAWGIERCIVAVRRSDGMIMMWAIPPVNLVLLDSEKGGAADDVLGVLSFPLVDPQTNEQPPIPSDGVRHPQWRPVTSFQSTHKGGSVLCCCELLQRQGAAGEGSTGGAALERVVNSQYKPGGLRNSPLIGVQTAKITKVQFGGPGVSRLKFDKEALLPVRATLSIVVFLPRSHTRRSRGRRRVFLLHAGLRRRRAEGLSLARYMTLSPPP